MLRLLRNALISGYDAKLFLVALGVVLPVHLLDTMIETALAAQIPRTSVIAENPGLPGKYTKAGKWIRHVTDNSLHERAAELRSAFQKAYESLLASGKLKPGPFGTDVTTTILPFIPVGTTFDEALIILKDAGFEILSYPNLTERANPNRGRKWYAVLARISPFVKGFVSQVDLYITLLPPSPGTYTIVSEISANFLMRTL